MEQMHLYGVRIEHTHDPYENTDTIYLVKVKNIKEDEIVLETKYQKKLKDVWRPFELTMELPKIYIDKNGTPTISEDYYYFYKIESAWNRRGPAVGAWSRLREKTRIASELKRREPLEAPPPSQNSINTNNETTPAGKPSPSKRRRHATQGGKRSKYTKTRRVKKLKSSRK